MTIRILLIIGCLAMLFGCMALCGLIGQLAQDATQHAMAMAGAGAEDDQKVTAVCVGLNIGSCNTTQESTSTRSASDIGDSNPWPTILLLTTLLCPMIFLVAVIWRRSEEW